MKLISWPVRPSARIDTHTAFTHKHTGTAGDNGVFKTSDGPFHRAEGHVLTKRCRRKSHEHQKCIETKNSNRIIVWLFLQTERGLARVRARSACQKGRCAVLLFLAHLINHECVCVCVCVHTLHNYGPADHVWPYEPAPSAFNVLFVCEFQPRSDRAQH